jgi:DNA-binding NarL/FixJ family response regulator
MSTNIRIALIDSDESIRFGRKLLLESQPNLRVVMESRGTQEDFIRIFEALIDVVVVDQRLAETKGSEFIEILRSKYSAPSKMPGVVLTSIFMTPELRLEALAAGAWDLVSQEEGAAKLLQQIPKAVNSAGEISSREVFALRKNSGEKRALDAMFSHRFNLLPESDLKIVELFGKVKSDRVIAETLEMPLKDVESKLRRILDGLGFATRAQLALALYENGYYRGR